MSKSTFYEETYHTNRHSYLINNERYYLLRAKLAFEKYFNKSDVYKKILEFGVGLGQNIHCLKDKEGFDISKFALNFAQRKGIQCYSTIQNIPSEYFDVVLCCHVLEHLDNPLESLKMIKQKLKIGGVIILILPREQNKKVSFEVDENYHLYSWNFRTANNLLNRAGFKILENASFSGTGYYKLMFLAWFNYRLWKLSTSIVGRIMSAWELKIVAKKEF